MNWNITSTQCVLFITLCYICPQPGPQPGRTNGPQYINYGFQSGEGRPPPYAPPAGTTSYHSSAVPVYPPQPTNTHQTMTPVQPPPHTRKGLQIQNIKTFRKQGSVTCCHKQISKWTYRQVFTSGSGPLLISVCFDPFSFSGPKEQLLQNSSVHCHNPPVYPSCDRSTDLVLWYVLVNPDIAPYYLSKHTLAWHSYWRVSSNSELSSGEHPFLKHTKKTIHESSFNS